MAVHASTEPHNHTHAAATDHVANDDGARRRASATSGAADRANPNA